MEVVHATMDDITEWLKLAAEVEYLFGSMVSDQNFVKGLEKTIGRSSAYCVRLNDGPHEIVLTWVRTEASSHGALA